MSHRPVNGYWLSPSQSTGAASGIVFPAYQSQTCTQNLHGFRVSLSPSGILASNASSAYSLPSYHQPVQSVLNSSSNNKGISQFTRSSDDRLRMPGSTPSTSNAIAAKGEKRQIHRSTLEGSKRQRVSGEEAQVIPVPRQLPKPSSMTQKITAAIWDYFVKNQQAEEIYRKKMKLRDALFGILQGVFPYCGLYVVGSSMSGFSTLKSDMDLCLMLTRDQIDQKREATEILHIVQRAFRKCSFIKKSQVIRAKVPIMKFWDQISNVECDLNINNSVGIRNTHLLKSYARMDWRVRPLILFIKYWARYHDINDARKQTISSYSLGLMAIHFLQYGCTPSVLPSLQKTYPEQFNTSIDISSLRLNEDMPEYHSENQQSLGDLFLGFLEYYANKFDFKREAISVRLGTKLPIHIVKQQIGTPQQWKCLCIEEPFDYSNTARAVYDEDTFQRVQRVIRNSYLKLNKKLDVNIILSRPF